MENDADSRNSMSPVTTAFQIFNNTNLNFPRNILLLQVKKFKTLDNITHLNELNLQITKYNPFIN